MDWSPVIAAGWAAVSALVVALWPLARAAIVEWTTASQMGRIAAAAGRVAAEIAIEVGQSPAARAAIDGMIEAGAAKIAGALPAAVKGLGADQAAIAGVVKGEVAKLLAKP